MSRLRTVAGRVAMLVAVLSLAACSALYRNHGYAPTDIDLAEISLGEDTRETVTEKIGHPSASAMLSDSAFYYVQSRWKHFGWRAPEEVDRQVIAVNFDEDGLVEDVGRYTLQDGRVVALSRRVTESNIKGVGFIRQLLGNLGNFNAGQVID